MHWHKALNESIFEKMSINHSNRGKKIQFLLNGIHGYCLFNAHTFNDDDDNDDEDVQQ